MTDQFDWNLVRSFLAISRSGSMTAAAKRLKIDYSTLSRRIAALEASLGSQLFDRRTSGSSLTEAGERLLEMAEQMDQLATSAAQSIGDSKLQANGAVRIRTASERSSWLSALANSATATPISPSNSSRCRASSASPGVKPTSR